jgi:RNA polymerase sigma-70 factor (ECF subfamily)
LSGHAISAPAVSNPDSATTDIPALVAREASALLAYFARRVTPQEDAADLLGDTLVIVWRRQSSIPNDETRARMWLYGVARKVLSTHRRSAGRRNALAERLRLNLEGSATDTAHDDSLASHVRSLIGDLDEKDQEIMGLVYWEGFSLVDVATILSMRPTTVRSRHARARAELRRALEDSGDINADSSL